MKEKLKADIVAISVKIIRDEETPDDVTDGMMQNLDKTWSPIGIFLEAKIMVQFEGTHTYQKIQSGGEWSVLTSEITKIKSIISRDRQELKRLLKHLFDFDGQTYDHHATMEVLRFNYPPDINRGILDTMRQRLINLKKVN